MSMEAVELGKEGSKEKQGTPERGRRVGECWRQLPRCCRINFGGPQTQTVSVDSIERFYRCSFLLRPTPLSRLARTCHRASHSLARINSPLSCSSCRLFSLPPSLFVLYPFVLTAILSPIVRRRMSTNSFVICPRYIIVNGCIREVPWTLRRHVALLDTRGD